MKDHVVASDDVSVALYSCQDKATEPYICFDSLIEDSRCPKGMTCVWAGTVLIKVSFHEGSNIHPFKIFLGKDTTINGYKIIFTDLTPYPDMDKPVPQPENIRATFSINR